MTRPMKHLHNPGGSDAQFGKHQSNLILSFSEVSTEIYDLTCYVFPFAIPYHIGHRTARIISKDKQNPDQNLPLHSFHLQQNPNSLPEPI